MRFYLSICIALTTLFLASNIQAQNKTENVILVTLDGLRIQEMFAGIDPIVLKGITKKGAIEDTDLYKKYWASTPQERREKLMPFFWGTLMKNHGSIAGNRELGSSAEITNKMHFSYPGYNEILTGQENDAVVTSNDKFRNPKTTVLEFLKTKLDLSKSKVASFSSWDVMEYIAQSKEGSITSNTGYQTYDSKDREIQFLNKTMFEAPSPWDYERYDYYTFKYAFQHMKEHKPKVMFLSFGDTDEWYHAGNYNRVLGAMTLTDKWLGELWNFVQTDPHYKGKTSIIITIDHGRGVTEKDWTSHNKDIPDAKYIWAAFISPDVSLRGEWKNTETVYQNQIAATLCKFLNIDYSENNPNAGKPVSRLFGK